jgi:PilZ domain
MLEKRSHRRFEIRFPVEITRVGRARVSIGGWTRDLSSAGVCFSCTDPPEAGARIEFAVSWAPAAARLKCCGYVLRVSGNRVACSLAHYSFQTAAASVCDRCTEVFYAEAEHAPLCPACRQEEDDARPASIAAIAEWIARGQVD